MSSFSEQFTNTDKSAPENLKNPTQPDTPEINNPDKEPILEQNKSLSSELTDNSTDINADTSLNFLDSVKEVFSSDNDPDTNPNKNDSPAVETSFDADIVDSASNATTEETGLTDKQLADEFGVNPSMVKRWRTGTSKPRGNNLKHLKQWEVKDNLWCKKTD